MPGGAKIGMEYCASPDEETAKVPGVRPVDQPGADASASEASITEPTTCVRRRIETREVKPAPRGSSGAHRTEVHGRPRECAIFRRSNGARRIPANVFMSTILGCDPHDAGFTAALIRPSD